MQDKDGAYFVYNMACTEADYDKLTPGTKIKVTGHKPRLGESLIKHYGDFLISLWSSANMGYRLSLLYS